jgi:hypothetical protein
MEVKNIKGTSSFDEYASTAEALIGKEDAKLYLENNKELFNHPRFYKDSCKVYFLGNCLKTASEKFEKDSFWATFHPDWTTNFGKIVIRKNMKDVLITRDKKLALQILNSQTL